MFTDNNVIDVFVRLFQIFLHLSMTFVWLLQIQLADVWLYTTLEFAKVAVPDAMEINNWTKQFVQKFEDDERIKGYLENRTKALL